MFIACLCAAHRGLRGLVLARELPDVDRPLAQLKILVSDSGELVAELEEALLTQSGQLEIRFDPPGRASGQTPRALSLVRADTRDSSAWIEAGLEHEASAAPKRRRSWPTCP